MPRPRKTEAQKKARISKYFKKYYALHKEEIRANAKKRNETYKTLRALGEHYESLMNEGKAHHAPDTGLLNSS